MKDIIHLNKTFKDRSDGYKDVTTYCGSFKDYESSYPDVKDITCKKCLVNYKRSKKVNPKRN